MKSVLRPGWDAVVKNWRPFIAIQIACILLVIAYYQFPAVQSSCAVLARWKTDGGMWFSAITMAIAAVVLPELARRLTRVARDKPLTIGDVTFQFLYFAGLGLIVDLLYRGLALLFGSDPTLVVVIQKVLVDMIVFSGFVSMPMAVVLFAWRDGDFNVRKGYSLLRKGGFWERYVPLLITCWAFWTPIVICLYTLPVNLQFVFAVLAEAAWCLLLVTAASRAPAVDKTIA